MQKNATVPTGLFSGMKLLFSAPLNSTQEFSLIITFGHVPIMSLANVCRCSFQPDPSILDSGINSKIENLQLQIALPSDIAQAVKSAGSVKFRQTFSREDTGDLITNNLSVLPPEADGSGGESDSATVTVHVQGSEQKAASAATSPKVGQKPCELGWVLRADGAECVMCPEGQTTFKIGENMCRDVTQEDILNTLYSVVHGEETWPEEKKRDWGTKKSACSWAGITCNEQGLITGISFPVVGISNY